MNSKMNETITEHIYYERGKEESSKLNRTKKDVDLWQDGYDKGFADAQEKLARLFDKKLSEILDSQ
jgi:hypothetical protein